MSAELDNLLGQKNREQLHKFVQETSTDEVRKLLKVRYCRYICINFLYIKLKKKTKVFIETRKYQVGNYF